MVICLTVDSAKFYWDDRFEVYEWKEPLWKGTATFVQTQVFPALCDLPKCPPQSSNRKPNSQKDLELCVLLWVTHSVLNVSYNKQFKTNYAKRVLHPQVGTSLSVTAHHSAGLQMENQSLVVKPTVFSVLLLQTLARASNLAFPHWFFFLLKYWKYHVLIKAVRRIKRKLSCENAWSILS